jgi:hypothetical protein
MRVSVPIQSIAAAAVVVFALSVSAAHAGLCVGAAAQAKRECKAICQEDYQIAKDACLNRDHACVEVCRTERADCRDAIAIRDPARPLDEVIAECDATLEIAKQACRDAYLAGTPERDHCIDQAQVVAFQCRDQAREDAKPALKECRRNFKTCAKACPPADPPSSVDPRQCKADAKAAYAACKDACIEDFQLAKDICHNRDHACVELCRDARDVCLQPVIDQLVSDVADCKATRDTEVQNCKDLYADGTPERHTCIDNAQVKAFQCRDQAREDARPGFEACRQDFQTCALACPPIQ